LNALIIRTIPAVMPMTLPVTMVSHAMTHASKPRDIKKTMAISRTVIPPMKIQPKNLLNDDFPMMVGSRGDANKLSPNGAGGRPQMFI